MIRSGKHNTVNTATHYSSYQRHRVYTHHLHPRQKLQACWAAYPSSLAFAALQVGSSQTLSATLTNSGGSDVTITQATTTAGSFTQSGLSLPTTLAGGSESDLQRDVLQPFVCWSRRREYLHQFRRFHSDTDGFPVWHRHGRRANSPSLPCRLISEA